MAAATNLNKRSGTRNLPAAAAPPPPPQNAMQKTPTPKSTMRKDLSKLDAVSLAEELRIVPTTTNEKLLLQQLESVTYRSHQFAREIERLRVALENEKSQAKSLVTYLDGEVRLRDQINRNVAQHLQDVTGVTKLEKETLKKHFEETTNRVQAVFDQKEAQLLAENKRLLKELHDLSLFKRMRHDLLDEIKEGAAAIAKNEERHKAQLEELSNKFVIARDKLEREALERIANARRVYKDEVCRELDHDARKMKIENEALHKQLMFYKLRSAELDASAREMRAQVDSLRRDVELHAKQDTHVSRRGIKQQNVINDMRAKLKTLEYSFANQLRERETEREQTDQMHREYVAKTDREMAKLQSAADIARRENRALKKHARTLLRQRKGVEQFLLDAIETVKSEGSTANNRRSLSFRKDQMEHERRMRELALPRLLKGGAERKPKALLPRLMGGDAMTAARVQVRGGPNEPLVPTEELTRADRERVIRLLFAHIKNQAFGEVEQQPHSFQLQLKMLKGEQQQQHHQQQKPGAKASRAAARTPQRQQQQQVAAAPPAPLQITGATHDNTFLTTADNETY